MSNLAKDSNCRVPVESNQVFWPAGKVVYSGVRWCWQRRTALQCENGNAGHRVELRLAQLHGAQACYSKES